MNGLAVTPQVILYIILLLLLGASAFFAGSETALMTVSRVRLRGLTKKQSRSARMVEGILQKPERLIGTILLGNSFANVAMSAIATVIAVSIWGESGVIYVTVALTLVILIFGELTPKVYARYHSERIAILTAPIIKAIMSVFHPITVGVAWVAKELLLLVGIDITRAKKNVVTEAEVKTLINISWEDGSISAEEKEMLGKIFALNDKSVGDVMVPKKRMVTLRSDYTLDQALNTVKRKGYSRYPVRRGDSQEIIGFIHAKDLLGKRGTRKLSSMKKLIRPPYFIPESKKINSQLRHFKSRRLHQAVVLDDEGEVKGLITLEDILEQMVGSIEDEYDVVDTRPGLHSPLT
jgi:putative hemolysin